MLPVPTMAVTEEKTNTCKEWGRPTEKGRPQIIQGKFGFMHQYTSSSTIRRRGGKNIFNGQGSFRHWHLLQLPRILNSVRCLFACLLFAKHTAAGSKLLFMRRPARSSFWRHARCIVGKTWIFPALKKISTIQIAISVAVDGSYMWKENRIYGLFSKSGIGVIRLELYLLIMPWYEPLRLV